MVDLKTVVPNASQYGAKLAYTTYEAEQGELKSGIIENQSSSKEADRATAREASGQAYVDLPTNASVSFIAKADANAATVRYTVPDGESGKVEVKVNDTVIGTLDCLPNLTGNIWITINIIRMPKFMIHPRQIGLPASNLTKSANYLKMPISIKEIQLPSLISTARP